MRSILLIGVAVLLVGCGGGGSGTTLEKGPSVTGFEFSEGSAVSEGSSIDARFTCDGANVSPVLAWTGAPEGTVGFALAVEDPDAPGDTFTHWLAYGLPADATSLAEDAHPPAQGENDFGDPGYGGPCPPGGSEHRYVFRLFALHAPIELEAGASRKEFDEAVAPHVIAEARLTARYARG